MPEKINNNAGPNRIGRFRIDCVSEIGARTLGAKLRRVLLDETAGMAATAVKIEGVPHEFQAVPGVYEDALQLIDNIRNIRVISTENVARATLCSLSAEVKAGDLAIDNGAVAEPDTVIAHLSPGAALRLEIVFERGTGYQELHSAPEGFLPVAADFSPIRRVAVAPAPEVLEITVETDGTLSPDAALREAMQRAGETREVETLPAEAAQEPAKVEIGLERADDPFMASVPPALDVVRASYQSFLTSGITEILGQLFPLLGEGYGPVGGAQLTVDKWRLDLVDHRLEPPTETPEECETAWHTYASRLIVKVRLSKNIDEIHFGYPHSVVSEQELDLALIPLMMENGSFMFGGARFACVMLRDDGYRVRHIGDLLKGELADVVSRMKPVLQARMSVSEGAHFRPEDILEMLPLSAVINGVFASSPRRQYVDETNILASLTHKMRAVSSNVGSGKAASDDERVLQAGDFGRLDYLETPEGPNAGLIRTLCLCAKLGDDGQIRTRYRKVKDGRATDEVTYLLAEEEKSFKIAGADTVGPDGMIAGEDVLVREGDDMRRVKASEVDLAAVSLSQPLGPSTSLMPFLGHNEPMTALIGSNLQRQAVPLIHLEQPVVKTGFEARIARDSGQLVTAKRDGQVIEATSERIVVMSDGVKDVYNLSKFRRSNQATSWNETPVALTGQTVKKGDVLADTGGTYGGEVALGRNVLVAYMPFRGYNFEDAICISDELVREEAFSSVNIEKLDADAQGGSVWLAPPGSRVRPGDVLAQESSGRKRALLVAPAPNPTVVIRSAIINGGARVWIAQKRNVKIGDKFAGRHGNKGVIARIVPRSEMPYMSDGSPVQMVLNPMGVISRMNVGQILETHYGLLARALGTQFFISPFKTPSIEALKAGLREAGLNETGMVTLYDGATGRALESPVTVGCLYMMKLAHMSDDKIHAIATGAPSIATHQGYGMPTGRQLLGALEMWALEAYGAGHILQESLTIKSDDDDGRRQAALALLTGGEIEPAGEGQSLQTLEDALRGLGISVEEER